MGFIDFSFGMIYETGLSVLPFSDKPIALGSVELADAKSKTDSYSYMIESG